MAKGRKTGGGSRAGKPNKATAGIKEVAQQYGPRAIERLVQVMESPDSPHAAQVRAAAELLDRGYGKARQSIDHSSEDGSMRPPSLADFYAEHGIKPERPRDA